MTTTANLENIYSDWSGELSEVRDANSGKTLWKLTNTNAKGQTLEAKLGAVDINNSYDANGFLTEIHHSSVVKPKLLEVYYSFNDKQRIVIAFLFLIHSSNETLYR